MNTTMPLPNGNRAYVDLDKLQGYCLNNAHPRGKHKARVFASHGITSPRLLQAALLEAAAIQNATQSETDKYGTRYEIRFQLNTAEICSIWIVRYNEDFPRLVTCYIP
jgi:hypothetical protein